MNKQGIQELIAMLECALDKPHERARFIAKFQQAVFDAPSSTTNTVEWQILRNLAYDLDFYEPDPQIRAEDSSYFGDEQAEREIRSALKEIYELSQQDNANTGLPTRESERRK